MLDGASLLFGGRWIRCDAALVQGSSSMRRPWRGKVVFRAAIQRIAVRGVFACSGEMVLKREWWLSLEDELVKRHPVT